VRVLIAKCQGCEGDKDKKEDKIAKVKLGIYTFCYR
jgi:hypothetical protein